MQLFRMRFFNLFSTRLKQLIISIGYVSPKRLYNSFKLIVSYFYSRNGKLMNVKYKPFFISVEPADFCNLRCPECPVGIRAKNDRPKETIQFELYTKVIDELQPTLMHTIFYFQGEPLLYKKLPEMIAYAHKANVYTSTSTNAQLLSDDIAKSLVESGVDKLIVSIDGMTQDTYETYRVGGHLQKAIDGVENIVRWKKALHKVTPFVEIQCLVLRTNEAQMAEMKELAKSLKADRVVFKTAQFYDFENGNPLMPVNEKFSRYRKNKNGKYELKRKMHNRCWRLWSGSVITVKGDVLPCCFDKDSTFVFGNVRNDSFENCWNSKKAQSFRKKLLNNRGQFEICKNCTS